MADATNNQRKSKAGRKGQVAQALTGAAVAAVEVGKVAATAPLALAPEPKLAPIEPALAKAAEPVAIPAQAPQGAAPANETIEPKPQPAKLEEIVKTETATIQTGDTIMTDTINNNVNKAQEATQQAAEQFRGAVNQANERGQAAMERSARFAEQVADLTRGNLEAVVASSKTAAKYVETLAQGAADYSRRSFEEASTAMRGFAEVKSPTDFFRLQSDYARSAFDAMIGETARVSETVVKMTGDVAEPITSRYAVAAERMKTMAA